MFEGTEGRLFVNRGKLVGKPVEDLQANPLPDDAVKAVYGGPVHHSHTANFIDAMRSRRQSIADVLSHNRMLDICHLGTIARAAAPGAREALSVFRVLADWIGYRLNGEARAAGGFCNRQPAAVLKGCRRSAAGRLG